LDFEQDTIVTYRAAPLYVTYKFPYSTLTFFSRFRG
jgi:hypothetical protein